MSSHSRWFLTTTRSAVEGRFDGLALWALWQSPWRDDQHSRLLWLKSPRNASRDDAQNLPQCVWESRAGLSGHFYYLHEEIQFGINHLEDMKISLYHSSDLKTEMAMVNQNLFPCKKQGQFVINIQSLGCWWPGNARSHGISSHGTWIDLVHLQYSALKSMDM